MSTAASASRRSFSEFLWIFRPEKTERDVAARPSDGLVVFAVMWGMATMFSVAGQWGPLTFEQGWIVGVLIWTALFSAALLVMNPRQTPLLILVSGVMITQYVLRMPISSNNQTIALFMNLAIFISLGGRALHEGTWDIDREKPYEQLRTIARALLAIMYFYGIFHKINTDFLDPQVSCATSLYTRLAGPFGLGDNVVGQYLAISSTFVIEGIAIVCLYWKRFFWLGLLVSLPFHYVIPISGFSWYMDFSSLVFALYMLSVPREVAAGLYATGVWLLRRLLKFPAGMSAVIALAVAWGVAGLLLVITVTFLYPDRTYNHMWHSGWLLIWSAFGGLAMLLVMRAALLEHPYEAPKGRLQSWWVYALPTLLFVTAASPYVGLKTESSIAMFSNLHTEGGTSNHLLFPQPPYLFGYQEKVARIIDTNRPVLMERAQDPGFRLVEHDIALRLLGDDQDIWITYEMDGRIFERVSAETYTGYRPNWLERRLLDFKPVDWNRPKVCTH